MPVLEIVTVVLIALASGFAGGSLAVLAFGLWIADHIPEVDKKINDPRRNSYDRK